MSQFQFNLSQKEIEKSEYEYQSQKKTIYLLSFSFMLMCSAYSSTSNLVATLYKNLEYNNLGLISLLLLNLIYGFSSLFLAKYIINKISFKFTFIISSIGYNCFTVSGIWVCICKDSEQNTQLCSPELVYFIVLFFSTLCGVAMSIIWVAQGSYIDSLCKNNGDMRGDLFGIFSAISQGSIVLGAVLSTFLIKYLDNVYFFIIMACLGLIPTIFFSFIPNIQQQNDKQFSIKENLKNVFNVLSSKKIKPLIPFMIMTGIIVGFYSGFLNKIVENSIGFSNKMSKDQIADIKSEKLCYVLIFLGIFEILGGIFSGKLVDFICVYKMASLGTLICLGAVMLCFLGIFTKNYLVCFFVASFWGFCDCFFQNITSIIASQDFEGQIEIFQIFRVISSFSYVGFQALNILLQNQESYILCMIIMVFLMFTNFQSLFFQKSNQEKQISLKINT
ncbi:major facilitator superfamily protein, putative [Ichthyophthirius multifiliis]|uniref:Major facilitator superfamily protein, putative n=1 Tax=Ichthyophthirius multifiliis TaxID=5932 RepID=G0QQZ0_ICHMU|nr:major facilitator superfamily protein, putative [Ichthyophthirius multifiliis]EGR32368.1 major facilitator superfamily protein, putative [Ichthyophthirius multifiliis]|eukprot:XP_004035854.1 major facilitator superfamily protein, putative [Ichthyophthirius multifiliis]